MISSLIIVVPTLDSFAVLHRLCASLRMQSFTRWRVVFVDGPSSHQHRDWLESCSAFDSRFSWISQDSLSPGIFGAMNQGFDLATAEDWLLFWGSDDWASGPNALKQAMNAIEATNPAPDLLVCQGRYASSTTAKLGRRTRFQRAGILNSVAYRRAMWFGCTPPHQATLIGPGARSKLSRYAPGFRLSADLNYFLQLSHHESLSIRCLDLELVHMADGGVSGQQTQRRLKEVSIAYRRAYGWSWLFPFLARYMRRLFSLMKAF